MKPKPRSSISLTTVPNRGKFKRKLTSSEAGLSLDLRGRPPVLGLIVLASATSRSVGCKPDIFSWSVSRLMIVNPLMLARWMRQQTVAATSLPPQTFADSLSKQKNSNGRFADELLRICATSVYG